MSTTLTPPPPPTSDTTDTLADLLDRLGNVPLHRIRSRPYPGSATEADVLTTKIHGKAMCELIEGVLVEKAMGYSESLLATFLIHTIDGFARPINLGLVTGESGMMRLWPGRVRIPDIAFIHWDRLPGRRVPRQPVPAVAPDLAIEVLSESNTSGEMKLKREDYFKAGTRLVWEIDPKARTVRVYSSVNEFRLLTENDTLEGGEVLPGFTLSLATLFAELDRQG
jgi:Uma2 family endonuclease